MGRPRRRSESHDETTTQVDQMKLPEESVAVHPSDDESAEHASSRRSRSRRSRSRRRQQEQDQPQHEAQAQSRAPEAQPQRNGPRDERRPPHNSGRKQARGRTYEPSEAARDHERPAAPKRVRETPDDAYRSYAPDEEAPRRSQRSRYAPRNPETESATRSDDEAYRSYTPDEEAPRRPRRSRYAPRNPETESATRSDDEAYRSYTPDEEAPRRSRYEPRNPEERGKARANDEAAPRRSRRSRYEPSNPEAESKAPAKEQAKRGYVSDDETTRRPRRTRYVPRNPAEGSDTPSDQPRDRGYQPDQATTHPPRRSRYAPRNPADGAELPDDQAQRSSAPDEGYARRPRRSRYEPRNPEERPERQRSSEAPPAEAGEASPRYSRRSRGPGRTSKASSESEAAPPKHEQPSDEASDVEQEGYQPRRRRVRRRRRRSKNADQQLLGHQHEPAFEPHESRTLLRPRPRSVFRPRVAADSQHFFSQPGEFGTSWWAQRWIDVLESFGLGSRLSRGRGYARGGSVLSIEISEGRIVGRVQGSRALPYKVTISVIPLSNVQWERAIDTMADQAIFTARLLANEMPREIEQIFHSAGVALFPQSVYDLQTSCTCPDFATPCKHAAAVYYQLGEYLDRDPFLIFALRGRGKERIIQALRARRADTAKGEGQPDETLGRVPSLEEQLKQFDAIGPELEQITPHIAAPAVASTMLRRYGPSPADTTMELHELYLLMSRATLERLFAHE